MNKIIFFNYILIFILHNLLKMHLNSRLNDLIHQLEVPSSKHINRTSEIGRVTWHVYVIRATCQSRYTAE